MPNSPKAPDDAALIDRVKEVSTNAAVELLTGIHRLKQLQEAMDMPGPGGIPDPSGVSDTARISGGNLRHAAATLALDMADQMIKLAHQQSDVVFDRLRRLSHQPGPGRSAVPLRCTASAPGTDNTADAEFFVYNSTADDGTLRFEGQGWRDQSGMEVVGMATRFGVAPDPANAAAGLGRLPVLRAGSELKVVARTDWSGVTWPANQDPAGTYFNDFKITLQGRTLGLLTLELTLT